MDHPKAPRFQGSRQDFSYLRTFDGHLAQSIDPGEADEAADFDARRNARTTSNADLGVDEY